MGEDAQGVPGKAKESGGWLFLTSLFSFLNTWRPVEQRKFCGFCWGPHHLRKRKQLSGLGRFSQWESCGKWAYAVLRGKDKCFVFDDKKTESVEEPAQGDQSPTFSRIQLIQ